VVAAPFEYTRVASFDEAVDLLVEHGEEAKVIAGGQSLVPMMNLRLVRPSVLIDINPIGPRRPSLAGETLVLPALTRHRTLLEDALVRQHCPLLNAAVRHVGNVRVRARGTIGGSLAHADPTAEIGASAVVLGAEVGVLGPGGPRSLAAKDLFDSYLTTTLRPDEVITEVSFPATRRRQGWGFREMVRRSSDLAIVAVAARVELEDGDDVVRSVAVSLAGVADRVLEVDDALLAGLVGTPADVSLSGAAGAAAAAVAASVRPASDVHASADYRRRLVEVLTSRALGDAVTRAREAA
jgi:aerobic carbon-monoxide dehydrogenase medium subunit